MHINNIDRHCLQTLLSLILSRSIYVCLSVDFRCWGVTWPESRVRVYVIYFRVHCADVTDMSPRYNLSPAVKIYRRHRDIGVWDQAAPAKKTTDLSLYNSLTNKATETAENGRLKSHNQTQMMKNIPDSYCQQLAGDGHQNLQYTSTLADRKLKFIRNRRMGKM